ncbi:MAG: molybdopterin-binding protein, partial [Desulfobacterales bacterium]
MYKTVKIEDAIGLVLGHDVTEIRKNEFKGRAFKKGHRIESADICHFQRLGKEHIFVLEIDENHLHENDAAMALAKAFCGAGVGFQGEPKEGKLNLVAQRNGLLKVAVDALTDINLLGDVMCASRHSNTLVKAGDTVAGTRAIPLTIAKAVVNEAVRIAESHKGLFEVKALRRARTGLVITGNEVFTRLIEDRFEEVLRTKIDRIGSKVIGVAFAPDNASLIASDIQRLITQGA